MSNQPQNSDRLKVMDDEIDLQRLWALLQDGRWLIIGTTLLALFMGAVYAFLATPIYRSDALLQVEEKQAGMPGFEELSEMFAEESSATAEIQIVRSRLVLGQVVDQFKMDILVAPDRLPLIGAFSAPDPVPEFTPYHCSPAIAIARPLSPWKPSWCRTSGSANLLRCVRATSASRRCISMVS